MNFLGFNLNSIFAEKKSENNSDVKVESKLDIEDINKIKIQNLSETKDFIKVDFLFEVFYKPDFAKISLKGDLLFSLEEDLSKKVLKEWKKKKIPEEFKNFLFNIILKKATIKAIELEDFLNLPSHIPLPSLKD